MRGLGECQQIGSYPLDGLRQPSVDRLPVAALPLVGAGTRYRTHGLIAGADDADDVGGRAHVVVQLTHVGEAAER
jgi:hypothetical protein